MDSEREQHMTVFVGRGQVKGGQRRLWICLSGFVAHVAHTWAQTLVETMPGPVQPLPVQEVILLVGHPSRASLYPPDCRGRCVNSPGYPSRVALYPPDPQGMCVNSSQYSSNAALDCRGRCTNPP
jgi:hypothetical protein